MRKYRYGSSYSSKSNQWLRNTLIMLFIGIPLLLISLELGLKNFAPASWLGNQSSNTTQTYELKLVGTDGKPLTNLPFNPPNGDLEVKTSAVSGYDLVPNQNYKFWQINAQGFRVNQPLPINKDQNQVRIFIIGNSTAFGTLAANNQATIAAKLEQLLSKRLQDQIDQPKKFQPPVFPYYADQVEKVQLLPPRIRIANYQVITAAVPGYTFTNQLSLWAHKISEFKPDCLIFLNGYEDLRSPSSKPTRELIKLEDILQKQEQQEQSKNQQQWENWLNSFYIVKAFRHLFTPTALPQASGYYQVFNANQLTADPQELKLRIANYEANLRKVANLNAQIPIIVALQPEITGKTTPTAAEAEIIKSLGKDYSDRISSSYQNLESNILDRKFNKIRLISLYKALNETKEQAFIDPIHLTDVGNTLIAKKLLSVIEDTFKLEPQPASGPS
ncbi:hypothetical protein Syn7502_02698 [Synechococcus sp. PCC 7502]|uniref:SGNH/GDSL hydrolase family protein n=1 Tax=Synechococcus sp. PCC 7502 TaxID=1173263 RepID=UPI00029FAC6C|nr:SGNH/GDSL hydrolase family protein [Synechococcus sp. PCC 7502]AFY74650.1 hypothetical protein Syn7502_02698 [Synechococcus sp. PCC 7502]